MISEQQFKDSALKLNVEVAAVKAVAQIEGGGIGLQGGKPIILFEPHVFFKLQRDAGFVPAISDICYPVWGSKPYPKGQQAQWDRMERAAKINRDLALQSASWGMFQCMGYNFRATGCKTLQEFVNAMYSSEDKQLDLFVNYILNEHLDDELRNKDWKGFARQYNGKYYFKNSYDVKLKNAYLKYSK